MAYNNQPGSWNSGENFNNPNSHMYGDDYFVPRCNICQNFGHHADQCNQENEQYIDENNFRRQSSYNSGSRLFGDGFNEPCNWCGSNDHLTSQCYMVNHPGNQNESCSYPATCEPNFQGSSWNSQNFNREDNQDSFQNFSSQQNEDDSSNPPCLWCKSTEHTSWHCPIFLSKQGSHPDNNPLDNREDSTQLRQQVEDTRAKLEKTEATVSSMLEVFNSFMNVTNQEMEKQAERIETLEHAKLSSEKIIECQVLRIEQLEATVDSLRAQLQSNQQCEYQLEAHSKKLAEVEIAVQKCKEEVTRVDIELSRMQLEAETREVNSSCQQELNNLVANLGFSDFDGENFQVASSNDLGGQADIPKRAFTEILTQCWEDIRGQLDEEELQQLKKIAQEKIDSIFPPAPRVLNREKDSSKQDCHLVRLGVMEVVEASSRRWKEEPKVEASTSEPTAKIQKNEERCPNSLPAISEKSITPPKSTEEPNTSCSSCGFSCASQLKACVNLLTVKPSMRKVRKTEIDSMKSKQKRKLQRKWVPRGTFDIKEMCRIDSIFSELKCIHQVLPRVKKRQKKPPDFNDSHD